MKRTQTRGNNPVKTHIQNTIKLIQYTSQASSYHKAVN